MILVSFALVYQRGEWRAGRRKWEVIEKLGVMGFLTEAIAEHGEREVSSSGWH
jgi:hypothetical protein